MNLKQKIGYVMVKALVWEPVKVACKVMIFLRDGGTRCLWPTIDGGKSIYKERCRQSLWHTVRFVETNMPDLSSCNSRAELRQKALNMSTLSGGLILEFGVYKGESLNHIARMNPGQSVYGFDSFVGLPEDYADTFPKGSFAVRRPPRVRRNVTLIKGWFEQTLPEFLRTHGGPVTYLHVDCDLYSSTVTILTLLEYRIVPGTVIVFDDFFNYPGWLTGEHKAFKEFIERTGKKYKWIGYNRSGEQAAAIIVA